MIMGNMDQDFNPEKYGMAVCPFCVSKGFRVYPKRQCCSKYEDIKMWNALFSHPYSEDLLAEGL